MAYNTTTLLLSFSLFIVIVIVAPSQGSSVKEAKVQIVFMERYPQVIEVQQHLRALASILGSEEAARKAIIYTYKNTINGFSAMLTDSQVAALSKQPGVLKVLPAPLYPLPQGQDPSLSSP